MKHIFRSYCATPTLSFSSPERFFFQNRTFSNSTLVRISTYITYVYHIPWYTVCIGYGLTGLNWFRKYKKNNDFISISHISNLIRPQTRRSLSSHWAKNGTPDIRRVHGRTRRYFLASQSYIRAHSLDLYSSALMLTGSTAGQSVYLLSSVYSALGRRRGGRKKTEWVGLNEDWR